MNVYELETQIEVDLQDNRIELDGIVTYKVTEEDDDVTIVLDSVVVDFLGNTHEILPHIIDEEKHSLIEKCTEDWEANYQEEEEEEED